MSEYPSQLEKAHTILQTKKNLPELFCHFVDALETLPSAVKTPEIQTKVANIFQDVNEAIQNYNQQFQVLMNELGILCTTSEEQNKIKQFFNAYLDLLRLAYTVYQREPQQLSGFQTVLEQFVKLLETNRLDLKEEEAFQNALFLQLVKSAWALTKSRESMQVTGQDIKKQRGGHKTRKQRRH